MLAAADAAAYSTFTTHDLLKQALEFTGIGEEMAMIAMVGKDYVARFRQGANHRHLADFLPDAGVGGTGKQAVAEQAQKGLFGFTNQTPKAVNVPMVAGLEHRSISCVFQAYLKR